MPVFIEQTEQLVTLTDEALVVRCKAELPGNTRSFEILVQRYMNRVYSMVYRVVSNKQEAEDIAQEVFVKVYHGLKKFEQKASFSSWLYRIATNSALDALAKSKRHNSRSIFITRQTSNRDENHVDALHLQASQVDEPETSVIQKELRECINRVLNKLEREQARLIVMRDFEDMSYDEIATFLEAGLSAVKMRIHRARLAFQEVFDRFCGSIHLALPDYSSACPQDNVKTREEGEP